MKFAGVLLAACAALSAFAATPVDPNGTSLPDTKDGKSVVSDYSKGKEAPIVQSGCVTPPDTEFRIGISGLVGWHVGRLRRAWIC
jgi:hypothetical protein